MLLDGVADNVDGCRLTVAIFRFAATRQDIVQRTLADQQGVVAAADQHAQTIARGGVGNFVQSAVLVGLEGSKTSDCLSDGIVEAGFEH